MNTIQVTPLGTVSPYGKEERNCPGFLVETENQKILLDCGNGISRMVKFPEILYNLSILISHYHVDHWSDLGCFQYASFVNHNLGILDKPISVYLPKEEFRLSRRFILENEENFCDYKDIEEDRIYKIGEFHVSFYDNHTHTIPSYVIKLEKENFKIVYTADIGPANLEELAKFSKDADLLICESSFLLAHQANSKTHMTASAAGKLAQLSCAHQLLLTHTWPEEDKNRYLEEARQGVSNTEMAEEGKPLVLKK